MCFDSSSFSFVKVMAGSGNLQTFRLLRYLRGRISAEGQMNYGLQMAVSIFNNSDAEICFSSNQIPED
jgi:anaphase-promoting complex subunit 1